LKQTQDAAATQLQRLMQEHGDYLKRLCFVYLRDEAAAEDAAQETFLKAYLAWASFRGESGEKTWLSRIAINTCRDFRRAAVLGALDQLRLAYGEQVTHTNIVPGAEDLSPDQAVGLARDALQRTYGLSAAYLDGQGDVDSLLKALGETARLVLMEGR